MTALRNVNNTLSLYGPTVTMAGVVSEVWHNDVLHNETGPARVWTSGTREWRINGLLHRTTGPAIEYGNGSKAWYLNGKLHREDGPAIEWTSGYCEWWIRGNRIRIQYPRAKA